MLRRRAAIALAMTTLAFGAAFVLMPLVLGEYRLWNARLLPFWFLGAYLLAAYAVSEITLWALGIRRRLAPYANRWPELVTPAACAVFVLLWVSLPLQRLPGWFPISTTDSSFVRGWASWNYNGYERKGSWEEYRSINATMRDVGKTYGCGRASWEYDGKLDRYGTPLAMMLLPYWTGGCIASMEGLYFESSATTPYHFLNAAEESKGPSNPQRYLPYIAPALDVDRAVEHFKMLGVNYYMAFSPEAIAQADANPDLTFLVESKPWRVYQVAGSELVEPLRYQPAVVKNVPTEAKKWLELSAPWFNDSTRWDVPLAANGPKAWQRVNVTFGEKPNGDKTVGVGVTVAKPDRRALDPVEVSGITSDTDTIKFRVDQVGVPVVVKASYYPNWRVSGADGPYRVTPNMMVVVPTSKQVTLQYGRSAADVMGWGGSLIGLVLVGLLARRRLRYPDPPPRRVRASRVDDPFDPFDDDTFDAALYGFLPVGGLEPAVSTPEPPAAAGHAFDLAPALARRGDESVAPEGDAEADEADERPWYSTQDRTTRGPRFGDDDGDLGGAEPGPLSPQDQLGVEQVSAESAVLDEWKQWRSSQPFDTVGVGDLETEPDLEDRREDEGDSSTQW